MCFRLLCEAELVRHAIESYSLTGHLSVLFAPLESDLFFSKILKTKHYGQACNIEIGTEKPDDPFSFKKGCSFSFLESPVFENYNKIFTFSHDAEYLYEIFLKNE